MVYANRTEPLSFLESEERDLVENLQEALDSARNGYFNRARQFAVRASNNARTLEENHPRYQ